MVFHWEGFVYEGNYLANNDLNGRKAYVVDNTCTGFGVNSAGYIATAGHCVDPAAAKADMVKQVATQIAGIDLQHHDVASWYALGLANWRVEGQVAGSLPDSRATVEVAGAPGQKPTDLPARVVDFRPTEQGDVALLKVEGADLPVVQLAPDAQVQVGSPVVSIGYPGATDLVTTATGATAEPTNKDGSISAKRNAFTVGYPVYEISAEVYPGMSGGPTVGLDGRVLGVNSFGIQTPGAPINFISSVTLLSELLNRNGLKNELGPIDLAYRSGLTNYYNGHYTAALADFDRVLALSPNQVQAAESKTRAFKAREQFGDVSTGLPNWAWYAIGGVAILVAAVGAVVLILLRRRRVKPTVESQSREPDAPVTPLPSTGPFQPPTATTLSDMPPQRVAPEAERIVPTPAAPAGRYCTGCGADQGADARFCASCGRRVAEIRGNAQAPAVMSPAATGGPGDGPGPADVTPSNGTKPDATTT